MPLEGGLYQWAKLGFNEFIGFMVAWDLWIFAILVMSGIGLDRGRRTSRYALGPGAHWMADQQVVRAPCSAAAWSVRWSAHVDARASAWASGCTTSAAYCCSLTFLALIGLPFARRADREDRRVSSVRLRGPRRSRSVNPALFRPDLNIFSKLALGALTGFEYVADPGGRMQDAGAQHRRARSSSRPRSSPAMFILGTALGAGVLQARARWT